MDPSILHFLLASGDEISSKQLRDDLMTMLIAGHETTAAVLTWTFHILGQHPDAMAQIRAEVRAGQCSFAQEWFDAKTCYHLGCYIGAMQLP